MAASNKIKVLDCSIPVLSQILLLLQQQCPLKVRFYCSMISATPGQGVTSESLTASTEVVQHYYCICIIVQYSLHLMPDLLNQAAIIQ